MTDAKKNGKPEDQTVDIPAEHAIVPVPFAVMQAITTYLTTKPFNEVNQFIQALAQIKTVDKRTLIKG